MWAKLPDGRMTISTGFRGYGGVLSGRPQTVAGVRKLITRKYPYLVYYTVDEPGEEIVILTIHHSSRKREHEDA